MYNLIPNSQSQNCKKCMTDSEERDIGILGVKGFAFMLRFLKRKIHLVDTVMEWISIIFASV